MENENEKVEFDLDQIMFIQDNPDMPLDEEVKVTENPINENISSQEPEILIEDLPIEDDESKNSLDSDKNKQTQIEETQAEAVEKVLNTEVTESNTGNEYNSIYNLLKETGYLQLPDDYEFDGSVDSLEKAFKENEQVKARDYINSFKDKFLENIPEKGKAIMKYLVEGGQDVDKFLNTYTIGTSLKDLDITDSDAQKRILSEYYKKTSNYDDDKISRFIEKFEKLDALQEEAEEALEDLIKIEKIEQQNLEVEERNEQKRKDAELENQRKTITASLTNMNNIDNLRKNKLKAFLFNKVTDSQGNIYTGYSKSLQDIFSNPDHFAELVNIVYDYKSDTGFNLERIEKVGKNKATKSFRDALEKNIDPKNNQSGSVKNPFGGPKVNMEDILKQMDF